MEKSKKAKLIDRIHENQEVEIVRIFISLLELLIEENRERNDTALAVEVATNQGAIKQLRYLLDIFNKHPVIVKK